MRLIQPLFPEENNEGQEVLVAKLLKYRADADSVLVKLTESEIPEAVDFVKKAKKDERLYELDMLKKSYEETIEHRFRWSTAQKWHIEIETILMLIEETRMPEALEFVEQKVRNILADKGYINFDWQRLPWDQIGQIFLDHEVISPSHLPRLKRELFREIESDGDGLYEWYFGNYHEMNGRQQGYGWACKFVELMPAFTQADHVRLRRISEGRER